MTKQLSETTYSIGEIAKRSNLSVHVIRAWEKRYGVVHPQRSDGGTRRYSETDLRRLQRLKAVIEAGHRIGDVVDLTEVELANLACGTSRKRIVELAKGDAISPPAIDQTSLTEIIDCASAMDAMGVERLLNVQYHLLGASSFRRWFCPALLTEIGQLWRDGQLAIAAEHLVSEILTRLLMRSVDGRKPSLGMPTVIFSTPEGERHRLGLLIAAGVAADAGAHVILLGANMPAQALIEAVRHARPFAVALSIVHMDIGSQRLYLRTIRREIDSGIELWVGGGCAASDESGCMNLDLDSMTRRISDAHSLTSPNISA